MNGKQFVEELHEKYGLLEGYDIAEEYIAISMNVCKNTNPAEIKFCQEVREALDELDKL